tara:strand:- start:10712 stop:11452 length:741 start_codon:yes stop_codon:yes gene_type:complete
MEEDSYLRELMLSVSNNDYSDTISLTSKATSAYTINPTTHGYRRMEESEIDKRDLQKAIKYGKKELGKNGRLIYKRNGLVYVTDETSKTVITCYRENNKKSIYDSFGKLKSKKEDITSEYNTRMELLHAIKYGKHDILNNGFNNRYTIGKKVIITDSKSEKILEKYYKDDYVKTINNLNNYKRDKNRAKVVLSTINEEQKYKKNKQNPDVFIKDNSTKYKKYNKQLDSYINKKGGLIRNYSQNCDN